MEGNCPGALSRIGNPSEFKDLTGYCRFFIPELSPNYRRLQLAMPSPSVQLCQRPG